MVCEWNWGWVMRLGSCLSRYFWEVREVMSWSWEDLVKRYGAFVDGLLTARLLTAGLRRFCHGFVGCDGAL